MNNPSWSEAQRLGRLWRFAIAISILSILGHTVFGFEQAWITPLLGLASAYSTELLFEVLDAKLIGRRPKFLGGGLVRFIDFFLSAHISGLAVGMLLYANERPWPVVFAAATGHCIEKHLPRADRQGDTSLLQSLQLRHQPDTGAFPLGRHRADVSLYRKAGGL